MRYKLFGSSGLRISEVALGTGTFGTGWGWGSDKTESGKVFTAFAEAGGNFIDTADIYQQGQSEEYLAEFINSDRDHFVVATKYTGGLQQDLAKTGNSRKNMMRAVDASLKRLQTDYFDLYWVHFDDMMTPIEEIVRGLDDLVRSGRVLYVGLSNFPAWKIAQAATIALLRGWSPLAGIQIEYSLAERAPERDLLPMAQDLGLGVTVYSPLGGGLLSGKYRDAQAEGRKNRGGGPIQTDNTRVQAIVEVLAEIGREQGVTPAQVALAWVHHHKGLIPILGARTLPQLNENLAALEIHLSAEQLTKLDEASSIALGYPHQMLRADRMRQMVTGGTYHLFD